VKAWGGRFSGKTDPLLERFSASIDFDWVLFEYDIAGSKAHAAMLRKIGILTSGELTQITEALDEIREEIVEGTFSFSAEKEDIHMHIESRLIEKIGDAGKKLHTGRSRNDQVALDMRMYAKAELKEIDALLLGLLDTLLRKATEETTTVMPGYTHLQRAQVVTVAHYLMAYYFMFKKDRQRMAFMAKAMDISPLGSGALAGSTIPLDRNYVSELLGFSGISENSMEAVSDRDFVLDTVYAVTMVMLHLSRFAEDLILYATQEFAFVSLPDRLCTGSSLMPHKKNPDSLELIRGKTSRVVGDLMALCTLIKGLPLTYNRDLQEDKEPLFHAVNTVKDALAIMELCIKDLSLKKDAMERAVFQGFMTATEMAEYLTLKGLPFREAHTVVGELVKDCEEQNRPLWEMPLDELQQYSSLFGEDVFDYIKPSAILTARRTAGGASFREIERTIEKEKLYLGSY
jgi:argininosuccinate lyase